MKFFNYLLHVKKSERSILQIIIWWEIRRLLYNVIVLFAGIISIVIMLSVSSGRVDLEPGEDFFEPMLIPMFAILCNLGYTLGWLTEICIKRNADYAPTAFKYGLYFTLFWIFLPMNIWIIIAILDELKNLI